jgi:MoaA/NifB/PqqE/SkfB family radical SAM enzyme
MEYIKLMNYLTYKKIINYLKYKNDLKHKKIITTSFPSAIAIQPSGYCNSNCRLCPVGLNIRGVEKGFLEFDTFKKIIDEVKGYLVKIFFGDWGEPFLNSNIFEMIKYAEKNKIATAVSTNFHQFKNENDLMNLLDCNLSFITISLHGISQKTYEAYQPGKNFEETIIKIKNLINLKKRMKRKKPVIELVFAITKKNQNEIEKMVQFTKNLGVDYSMYTASLNLRFYLKDNNKIIRIIKEWAQDEKLDLWDNTNFGKGTINKFYKTILKEQKIDFKKLNELELTAKHFCIDPWTSLVINWNGTVSLCCVDYSKFVMGDANKEPLMKIWNNENYIKIRRFLLNQLPKKDVNIPCINCVRY